MFGTFDSGIPEPFSPSPVTGAGGIMHSTTSSGINRQSSWYGGGVNALDEMLSGGSLSSSGNNSANALLDVSGSEGFDNTSSAGTDRGGGPVHSEKDGRPGGSAPQLLRRRSSAFVSNWANADHQRYGAAMMSDSDVVAAGTASAEYAVDDDELHTDYRDILSAEKTRFDLHEVLIQIGYPPCAYSNTRRQYRKRRPNDPVNTGVFSESEADAFIRDEILYPFLKPMTLETAIKEELLYRNVSVSGEMSRGHSGMRGKSFFYSGVLSTSSEDRDGALSSGNASSTNVSGGHSSIDVNRNQSAVYSEAFQAGGDSLWEGSNSATHNGVMTARNGGHWLTVAVVDTGARALADRRPGGYEICKSVVEGCLAGTFDSHMVQHELAGSNFNNITRFTIPFEPVESTLPVNLASLSSASGPRQAWKAQTVHRFSGFERPQKYFEFLRDVLLRRFTPSPPGSSVGGGVGVGVGSTYKPVKRTPSSSSSSSLMGGGSSSTEAAAVSTNYQRSMLVVHSDMSVAESHAAPFRLQGWACYISPNNDTLLTHPKLHDTDAVLVCTSCRSAILSANVSAPSGPLSPSAGPSAGSVEAPISDILRELGYMGAVVCVQDVPGNTAVLNKTFSLVLSIPILTNSVETVNALVDKALLSYIIGASSFAQSSS
jgi:hypothetical protein